MSTLTERVIETARTRYGVTIYDHAQWGSRARDVYTTRLRTRPVTRLKADTLVQHITVTALEGIGAAMRTLERIGLERFGSGVSYNFAIHPITGEIGLGAFLEAKGTHTVNDKRVPGFSRDQNAVARAVAVIGMPGVKLRPKAIRALAGLIAAMVDEGALTPTFDYEPHSRFAWKDCPSDDARAKMPQIYRLAEQLRAQAAKPPAKPKPGVHIVAALRVLRPARNYARRKGLTNRVRALNAVIRTLNNLPNN